MGLGRNPKTQNRYPIEFLEWVPKSPDLAPQENVWAEGKRHLFDMICDNRRWRIGASESRTKAEVREYAKFIVPAFKKVGRRAP